MTSKVAKTDHHIEPALASRWSPRAFSHRIAEEDVVSSLFEAARWTPSAFNLQPWAFIYASRGTDDFKRICGCLKETNALWAGNAALLVLALTNSTKPDGNPNPHAQYDLGQAVAHLTFQATGHGLHVHQMAGFDPVKARAELNIPSEYEAMTAIAVGYLGDVETLPAPLQERERGERTRKPTKTFAFLNRWPDTAG